MLNQSSWVTTQPGLTSALQRVSCKSETVRLATLEVSELSLAAIELNLGFLKVM